MLVVEESGYWGQLIKSYYRLEIQLEEISAAQLTAEKLTKSRLVAVEYRAACLDSWGSLFDKNGFRLENHVTALLNAPVDGLERSWCRELGFQYFVDDLESLIQWIDRWKDEIPTVQNFGNLADEMFLRLPWSDSGPV